MKILELLKDFKINSYKAGTIIFEEGEICNSVCFVKTGSIKIVSFTNNGNDILYNRINTNGMFGAALIFSDDPYYQGDVIAETNCEIYNLTKDELIKLLQSNNDFIVEYLSLLSNSTKESKINLKILTFNSVDERLIYYINIKHGEITFKSITELASRLFVSRESLSRSIHKLTNKKRIALHNKTIKLVDN